MALIIETVIVCDGCNVVLDADMCHLPATVQRTLMQGKGWRHTGTRDLCPACRSKLRGGGYKHRKKRKYNRVA